jgi:hypothetical protein
MQPAGWLFLGMSKYQREAEGDGSIVDHKYLRLYRVAVAAACSNPTRFVRGTV